MVVKWLLFLVINFGGGPNDAVVFKKSIDPEDFDTLPECQVVGMNDSEVIQDIYRQEISPEITVTYVCVESRRFSI